MPAPPTARPPTATRTGRPAATTEPNISRQDRERRDDADELAGALDLALGGRRQLAAEGDLQPGRSGGRDRPLQGFGVAHQVAVRDRYVVPHREQHGGAIFGDARPGRPPARAAAPRAARAGRRARRRWTAASPRSCTTTWALALPAAGRCARSRSTPRWDGVAGRRVPVLLGRRPDGGREGEDGRGRPPPRAGSCATGGRRSGGRAGRGCGSWPEGREPVLRPTCAGLGFGVQAGHK